ncbi:hypothetical protein ABZW10_18925 [Kitasatospora sp. NPDC004723]|uniref:hypothetical protein n=1 Tax=Kitasatospora sp. NPDC004723 TaxID=3154288 RepID=UPI0033A3C801
MTRFARLSALLASAITSTALPLVAATPAHAAATSYCAADAKWSYVWGERFQQEVESKLCLETEFGQITATVFSHCKVDGNFGWAEDWCDVNKSKYRLTAPDGTVYNGAIPTGQGKGAWTLRSETDHPCSTGTWKYEISSSTTFYYNGKPTVDTSQSKEINVSECG